jgi:peroxiredoxin Q/BCP
VRRGDLERDRDADPTAGAERGRGLGTAGADRGRGAAVGSSASARAGAGSGAAAGACRERGETGGFREGASEGCDLGGTRSIREEMRFRASMALVSLLVACGRSSGEPPAAPPPVEAAPRGMLAVGDPAPPLVAVASNGAKVDLAAMRGKHVAVYFYPKDDTPGCTKQACAFRDAWSKLQSAGIEIVGVSVDDDESHRAFAEKYSLPFPLVADPDKKITQAFGVPLLGPGFASRVTYLVGPDGKIAKVYPNVDPAIHAEEILQDAAK